MQSRAYRKPAASSCRTAVAVNPDDTRYIERIGQSCILPLMNREIPIIADGLTFAALFFVPVFIRNLLQELDVPAFLHPTNPATLGAVGTERAMCGRVLVRREILDALVDWMNRHGDLDPDEPHIRTSLPSLSKIWMR